MTDDQFKLLLYEIKVFNKNFERFVEQSKPMEIDDGRSVDELCEHDREILEAVRKLPLGTSY